MATTCLIRHQVVAMVLIIICFAVGVGNVEGFIISEIMPVYAKDTLMSIGQPLNWLANLIVSTFFPILFQATHSRPTPGPLTLRGSCTRLSSTWDRLPDTPSITPQGMGRYAYLIFVGLTFFFGWFTYHKLPETKGKTIAQVTKDFENY